MSLTLLHFIKSFMSGRLEPVVFTEAYMELWKIERDLNKLFDYPPHINEVLSSIFCISDNFCAEEDHRLDGEFNEEQLRQHIKIELARLEI